MTYDVKTMKIHGKSKIQREYMVKATFTASELSMYSSFKRINVAIYRAELSFHVSMLDGNRKFYLGVHLIEIQF